VEAVARATQTSIPVILSVAKNPSGVVRDEGLSKISLDPSLRSG
jgi:hypothetical protein